MVGECFFGIALSPFNGVSVCSRTESFPSAFPAFSHEYSVEVQETEGVCPVSHWSKVWTVVTSCPQAHRELPLLPSALINLPRYPHFCKPSASNHSAPSPPGNTRVQHGGSLPGTATAETRHRGGSAGPGALLFPLVDALVPWQLLAPNSCGERTALE